MSRKLVRVGRVIRLKVGGRAGYQNLHEHIWPQVRDVIKMSGIQNYSIFCIDDLLFSYYEVEEEKLGLMETLWAEYEVCQRWEQEAAAFQKPFSPGQEGEGWVTMEPLFFIP